MNEQNIQIGDRVVIKISGIRDVHVGECSSIKQSPQDTHNPQFRVVGRLVNDSLVKVPLLSTVRLKPGDYVIMRPYVENDRKRTKR